MKAWASAFLELRYLFLSHRGATEIESFGLPNADIHTSGEHRAQHGHRGARSHGRGIWFGENHYYRSNARRSFSPFP